MHFVIRVCINNKKGGSKKFYDRYNSGAALSSDAGTLGGFFVHDTAVFKEITVADGSQIGGVRLGKKKNINVDVHIQLLLPVIIIKCFPQDIRDEELNSETQRSQS